MESEAMKKYKAQEAKRVEINLRHLENGVEFVDLYTAYIEEEVEIGRGTVIGPCVTLKGNTVIGENSIIGGSSFVTEPVPANTKVMAQNGELTVQRKDQGELWYWEI